jgi:aerobic-type carbon monoxide dehydrogenase small subunit (CoxS/CutS family)
LAITVNDKQHAVAADPDTPLLYGGDELGLMAAKFGLARCGVCSVFMDMREIRACVTPVSTAQGKSIVTLESLPGSVGSESEEHTTAAASIQQAIVPASRKDEQGRLICACASNMQLRRLG